MTDQAETLGRETRSWRIAGAVYLAFVLLWIGLRLAYWTLGGNVLGMASAVATLCVFGVGAAAIAVGALVNLGAASRIWVRAVLGGFLLAWLSLSWIDPVGQALFEDRQRSRLGFYEMLRVEHEPPGGEGKVRIEGREMSVLVYEGGHGHFVFALHDAKRRLIVRFDDPLQPRAPRFDHVHLHHLEGN